MKERKPGGISQKNRRVDKITFVITDGFGLGFLIVLLILRYGYAPYGFFKKIGIRGPKPLPFIGTFLEYRKVRRICHIVTVI